VTAVPVGTGQNRPGADANADGEVLLDIEVAGAAAPGASIAVYFSDFTLQGWVDALTHAIHDTTHNPSVLSISWGFAENEPLDGTNATSTLWTPSAVSTVNQALQAAATLGVTVICAAGDDGSSDQFNDGLDHVDFPASSPYILACGGTKLVGSNGTIESEVVWNEKALGEGATGGGISSLIPRPSYQPANVVPPSHNPGNFAGRGVPDVAGNADPSTGFRTLVDGQAQETGGTSAVAPLWAALIARINQGLNARAGFFNPLLYATIGPAGVLKDITQGNNGDYEAGPGWDACTGWGSPDGAKLLEALKT
jgi:kumamolisin